MVAHSSGFSQQPLRQQPLRGRSTPGRLRAGLELLEVLLQGRSGDRVYDIDQKPAASHFEGEAIRQWQMDYQPHTLRWQRQQTLNIKSDPVRDGDGLAGRMAGWIPLDLPYVPLGGEVDSSVDG
jgi:hypothetical protein